MPLLHHRRALLAAGLTSAAVLGGAAPALADLTPQTLPFAENWTDISRITTDGQWANVPGVIGYRGDGLSSAIPTDSQTVTADGSSTPVNVEANELFGTTNNSGGVYEFHTTAASGPADPSIALNGSGTADNPHIVASLNTTGNTAITVGYVARDLDPSGDNAVQQVAVQFRVGMTGAYTNVPAGYVADATTTGTAVQRTARTAVLPASAEDKPVVQVRFITTNAAGNDEFVGLDDIAVTGTSAPSDDCTITGTDAGETLTGTAGDDVICGRGGDDILGGAGGNDILRGEGGNDILRGDDGNDELDGGEGTDRLDGGLGADAMNGGANPADVIRTFVDPNRPPELRSGGDVVEYRGRRGAVRVDLSSTETGTDGAAGEGDTVGSDVENVLSGAGADTLIGDGVRNVLNGDVGNDTIRGGGGDDFLFGRGGNDMIDGEDGVDSVNGQEGDDTLTGGLGSDSLDGFTGNDTLDDADGDVETKFDCGAGFDVFNADIAPAADPVVNCELPAGGSETF